MRKDPKEFRERFLRWKAGALVYDNGRPIESMNEEFERRKLIDELPAYRDGKSSYDDSTDFISRYEGWSDTAYQKKGDVPTIGYGTTNKKWVSKGRITRAQGRLAMMEDLAANEPFLQRNIRNYDMLPDTAKTVLRDILYNVGHGNMFNKSPKFMLALNAGNWEEAARLMDWDNNKPGFSGARKRNAARLQLFLQDLRNNPVQPQSEFVQQLSQLPAWKPKLDYIGSPTQYPLHNTVPQSISSWSGPDSPSAMNDIKLPNLVLNLKKGMFELPKFADGKEGDEDVPTDFKQYMSQVAENFKLAFAGKSYSQFKAEYPYRQLENTAKAAQAKHATEAVGQDTRSSYQQKQSYAAKQYANQQHLKAKDDAKRAEGLELMMATVSPSTYVEAATGKDFGEVGRFAIDAVIFGLPNMVKYAAKKAIAPAARYMTNAKNFTFGINLGEPLQKPMLALPSPQQSYVVGSVPPEATYTGRIPSKILDIKSVLQKNLAKQMLSDIANDPNDYTFEEINDVLNKAYLNEGTVPIEISGSGKTIQLGNNVLKELLKVNAILKRYGYEEIPEGMDDVATRLAVLDRAAEHRLFGRGVYLKPRGSEADKAVTKLAAKAFGVPEELVTAEMKLQTAATHTVAGEAENGRQGLNDALNHYGLRRRGLSPYDAIYTSNRDAVMAGYSNPGYGNGSKGQAYLVQMPVNDTPNASLTELWENNEFPIMRDYDGKLTLWRTHELPYMLKTGKGFDESALSQNPKYKDIVNRYDALFERNKAMLEGQKIKYSDTTSSPILKLEFFSRDWDLFNSDFSPSGIYRGLIRKPYLGNYGLGMTVEGIEDLIARNYAFLRQFGKPVQPVVERKLGAIKGVRNKLGKILTRSERGPFLADDEEEFYQPDITKVTIKYPRAYKRFSDGLSAISEFLESAAIRDYNAMLNSAEYMHNLGIITEKLFKAVKNSLKGEHPNPEKYIDIANAVKLALRNYFKSLGKERSADAFVRKTYVERHNKELDNTISAYKLTSEHAKENELKEIKKQYFELLMSEVGAKPNYSKKSKDGYRVFTTEGIRMPDPKDEKGTHFVVVGPKDTKLLDIKGKYYPKSNRKHHGHEGLRVPGLSRNLGGIFLPIGLSGTSAYEYYINNKE